MLGEDMAKYRLESLKMAYEATYRINKINFTSDRSLIHPPHFVSDVFNLSDINLDYILHGYKPSEEKSEGEDEEHI